MAFMQKQITEKMDWLSIDGDNGIIYLPLADSGLSIKDVDMVNLREEYDLVRDYYNFGAIYSVEIISGHGCRLSAPGYMDCTEWTVCSTPEECAGELERMYGDDYAEE